MFRSKKPPTPPQERYYLVVASIGGTLANIPVKGSWVSWLARNVKARVSVVSVHDIDIAEYIELTEAIAANKNETETE